MKKYILIPIIVLLVLFATFFFVAINGNYADFTEDGTADYAFNFEGGSQSSIMRKNEILIDSGAVDFKYNDDYVVFSVDTTYSMDPEKIKKAQLKYYIHDVKKDVLYKNIDFMKFKKIIQKKKLEEIDISE